MDILPAIDLMDGGCVRLTEGDFNARQNYAVKPLDVAKGYEDAGAKWLHMVDLDGARDPQKRQIDVLKTITSATKLNVQTGGGIRNEDDVKQLLDAGVTRVIIGSLAVKDIEATKALLDTFGAERIVLAIDVKGNFETGFFATTSGWQNTSQYTIEALLDAYKGRLRHVLCTDIAKDGKLQGANTQLYVYLVKHAAHIAFQASGGVATLDDVRALKATGAAGCIIGKALYEGKFSAAEALAC